MKFRIVEFQEELNDGNKFFVEIGTPYYTLFLGFIPCRTIIWKKNLDEKNVVVGHKTFDKGLEMIEELKKQAPKYHRVL